MAPPLATLEPINMRESDAALWAFNMLVREPRLITARRVSVPPSRTRVKDWKCSVLDARPGLEVLGPFPRITTWKSAVETAGS